MRTRTQAVRLSDSFFAIASGAISQGQLGCDIWIARNRPWSAKGKEVFVTPKDVAVLHASPRRLFIAIRAGPLKLDVLCSHAPHTWQGEEPPRLYWNETKSILSQRDQSAPLVLLADADATVGQVISYAVMMFAPEPEGPGTESFLAFLDDHNLYFPSTFEWAAQGGQQTTFVKSHGMPSRIECVALPEEWVKGAKTLVDASFDLLQARDDHHPVLAEVICEAKGGADRVRRRVPACDRSQLRPGPAMDAFTAALSEVPVIEWGVAAASHWRLFFTRIRELLARHFPWQEHRKRKPWISDEAWELVLQRAEVNKAPPITAASEGVSASMSSSASGKCAARARRRAPSTRGWPWPPP